MGTLSNVSLSSADPPPPRADRSEAASSSPAAEEARKVDEDTWSGRALLDGVVRDLTKAFVTRDDRRDDACDDGPAMLLPPIPSSPVAPPAVIGRRRRTSVPSRPPILLNREFLSPAKFGAPPTAKHDATPTLPGPDAAAASDRSAARRRRSAKKGAAAISCFCFDSACLCPVDRRCLFYEPISGSMGIGNGGWF